MALPELLVAAFVGAVVMAAVIQFFTMQLRTTRAETARVTAQVTARATLQLLARHLEHIGRDPQHTLMARVRAIEGGTSTTARSRRPSWPRTPARSTTGRT